MSRCISEQRYSFHSHTLVITDHGSNDTAIQDKYMSGGLVTHGKKSLLSTKCRISCWQSKCTVFVYTLCRVETFFVSVAEL